MDDSSTIIGARRRPSEEAARLGSELWTIASEQVVHFSRRRVPLDLADLEPIDDVLAWMHQAAADVLAVAEEFVTAIEEAGWPQAGFLRRTLDEARQALQAARRRTPRTCSPGSPSASN